MKTKLHQLLMVCMGFVLPAALASAQTIQPIYCFTNSGPSSLCGPRADLVLGSDGSLYGTTENGGSGGFGTAFKITTSGALTVLANFDANTTGGSPNSGLSLGPDGSLYGTTYFSGPGFVGTIFRVATNGGLTRLYSFTRPGVTGGVYTNADGGYPYAGLTLGPDGCFYGSTSQAGLNGTGTLFRMTTNGVLTTLFYFEALRGSPPTNTTGASPHARLTLGPDGNFYGTAYLGGSKGDGTAFRLTTSGAFTLLANFVSTNGTEPIGTLVVGPDNALYGTTLNGGIHGDLGTVFRLTTNGVLTTLLSFAYNTGAAPEAGVVFGPDGNLYGTTTASSSLETGAYGTVFRLTLSGVLTTLANFTVSNGSTPRASVTLGPDGAFYGTTYLGGSGGANAAGEVYRLNVGLTVTNYISSISRGDGGAVILTLASTPGSTNRLWATTNSSLPMAQWQVLGTTIATNGYSQFTDTNTSGNPVRFYRASTP